MSKERSKIILNVDNTEAGRQATTNILKRAGFEVWEAASGREALEILRNSPDLVVLEVNLPDMSGFEVCKRIKSDPVMKSIPVLHLSATYTTSKDRVSGLSYGADCYLVHPVEPDELVAHINTLLRLKKGEQELQAANRLYALLSDINQAIVRIKERQELFQAVCKIAVETGKFLMAWVGLIDEESGAVSPAVSYGDEDGYLKQLSLNYKVERPPGIPTITATQEGKLTTVNDIETDSRTQPWREQALKRGYRSLAMIPLRLRGKYQGNLVIYSGKPGFFTGQEVKLLEEIGVDISYALEMIEAEKERKRTEEKLRESEGKFSTAFRSSPAIVAITTIKEGKYVEVNDSYIYSTGYTRDELIGRPTSDFNIWANADDRIRMFRILKEKGRVIKEEFDFRIKSGEIRTWLFSAEPVNIAGELCLIGIAVDITEHQRAEEALRQSEAKYASLVEKGNDGIIIIENGVIQFVNTKMTEITGFTRDEALGRKFAEFFLPEESTQYLERHLKRMSGENLPEIYETTLVSRHGHSIPVEINASITVHQGRRAVMAIIRDISGRKKSQEALIVSETRYRRLFEAAKDGILILDAETGQIVDVNPFLEKMLGFSHKEFTDKKIWELGFLKDTIANRASFEELQNKGYIRYDDLPLETADGRKAYVEFVSNVYMVDHQKVVQCNIRDITERKRAEEMLRQSIERFKQITESADEWIWEVDAKGMYSYCSGAVERILGYAPDELVGKRHFYDFFSAEVREELKEAALAAFQRKQSFKKLINTNIHKNGKTVVLETNGSPMLDENGNLLGYRGVDNDITEIKQAESALKESEEKFRNLADQVPNSIFIHSGKQIVYVNNKAIQTMGYSKEELCSSGFNLLDLIAPEFREQVKSSFSELMRGRDVPAVEYAVITKDTKRIDVILATKLIDYGGQRVILGTITDISGRKQAEVALRESEARFRELFNHMSSGVALYEAVDNGEDFVFRDFNPAAERIEKVNRKDILGKRVSEVFPGVKAFGVFEVFRRVWQTGEPEYFPQNIYKDERDPGSWRENWIFKLATGEVVAVYNDITERKRAEAKIEEEAIRRRILIDQSRDGIVVLDNDGKVYEANQQFARMLGYTPEEVRQLGVWDWEYQFTPEKVLEMIRSVDEKGDHFETRHRRKDGTIYEVEISTNGAMIAGQKLIFCVCRDITERRKAEEQLRYQASLVDSVSDAIFSRDMNFKVLSWNKAAERMYGWKAQEVIGKDIREIFSIDFLNNDAGTIEKELREKGYWRIEVIHRRRDGSPFNVIVSSIVVKGGEGKAAFCVVIVTDITEEKKLEKERQKNVRLESIGTLAGGIAHDFNNVLTGILGNIQLASGYLKQNKADTAQEMLVEAEKASLRARDITQQLLTFSRGGVPVKKVMLIDRLIRESIVFALRGSKVKPEFSLPDNLWAVEADEGQLNQVINNLAINADQAMPNGGIINVNASNTVIKKNSALPLPDGDYIEIAIKDYGIGIPKENKDRIFDAYFTTKQKGSGLGLATSYSIIKNHGGYITFESELGVGTTFHVYLPATEKKVKKEQEELSTQPLPLTRGRILVMDDEDVIRTLLSRMLKGAGYEVESTAEGAEAIRKYTEAKNSGKPFDAVILDLTVPGGMGGKEAIVKLLEIDPGVKAIVSSGYATDPIMADHKKYGFSAVVTKPYDIKDMQKTLNDLLTAWS